MSGIIQQVTIVEGTSAKMLERENNSKLGWNFYHDIQYTTYIDQDNEVCFSAILITKN